ncbi:MAG TPA: MarR family winged helix-turn-helix transcriptional regulator [Anaerolineales bacterium]
MADSQNIADDFAALFARFVRLRPKLVFPDEQITALKRQMHQLKASGNDNPGERMFLFRTLAILSQRETPPTMGELSAELGMPLSSATRMADVLVRAKFAERCDDAHDRRVVRLCMTRTGRQFIQAGGHFMRARIQHLLSRFTPDEQAELLRLLKKLIDSIEAEN